MLGPTCPSGALRCSVQQGIPLAQAGCSSMCVCVRCWTVLGSAVLGVLRAHRGAAVAVLRCTRGCVLHASAPHLLLMRLLFTAGPRCNVPCCADLATPCPAACLPCRPYASRTGKSRKRTEEGYAVYTEDELGLGSKGGDTSLCPFDCDCCF